MNAKTTTVHNTARFVFGSLVCAILLTGCGAGGSVVEPTVLNDTTSLADPIDLEADGSVDEPIVLNDTSSLADPIEPITGEPAAGANILQAPSEPRATLLGTSDVAWEWNEVSGANSYDISIDGSYHGSTFDTQFTSYDLTVGQHTMSVLAVDANGITSIGSSPIIISIAAATVVVPDDQRQQVDLYLLSGQSNANVETFSFLKHTLDFYYHDYPEHFSAAHWNMGGASIHNWIDVNSNKQQYWINMMEQLDLEVDAQLAAGKILRSVNLLWIQGENDAIDGTSNYGDFFTALVESWNAEIATKYAVPAYISTGLPWVQECHNLWDAYFRYGLPPIRQAQIDVASRYPNVGTWETSDIYRNDCVHIADHWLSTERALETAVELREQTQRELQLIVNR